MNEIACRKPAKREFATKPKPKPYETLHQEVGSGISYEGKPNRSKPKSDGDWYKNESMNLSSRYLHKVITESIQKLIFEEGDYVSSGYADKDGEIYRNPKNGHVKRVKIGSKYETKPNKVGDYVSSGYADKDGRIFRNPQNVHVKRVPFRESKYYNPRTYERDESKEFSHDEIKTLVSILKENPIEEMWKPYDLGWCKVQRVEANKASGRSYLISDPHDMTNPQDMYSDGNNGTIYLQVGRMPNTHWLDESGYTYMCWKW